MAITADVVVPAVTFWRVTGNVGGGGVSLDTKHCLWFIVSRLDPAIKISFIWSGWEARAYLLSTPLIIMEIEKIITESEWAEASREVSLQVLKSTLNSISVAAA